MPFKLRGKCLGKSGLRPAVLIDKLMHALDFRRVRLHFRAFRRYNTRKKVRESEICRGVECDEISFSYRYAE